MTDATAAVSPLRRRMIDDMSVRNLSPATQRSYLHGFRSSVATLGDHRIGSVSKTFGRFRSISFRRGFPGRR
jgi:hypothetical protein